MTRIHFLQAGVSSATFWVLFALSLIPPWLFSALGA
jgi:hypothetical protein